MDKNQLTRFTQSELELIKSTFGGDGLDVLYEVRNVLLQFEYNKEVISTLSPGILTILRREFLPGLDREVPINQQSDLYFSIGNIKEIMPEVALKHIEGIDIVLEYLTERLDVLEGKEVTGIQLQELKKSPKDRFVGMFAYMLINSFVDKTLVWFKTCASTTEKTPEQIRKEEEMNSSQ